MYLLLYTGQVSQLLYIRLGVGTISDDDSRKINIPMGRLKKLYVACVHAFYYI